MSHIRYIILLTILIPLMGYNSCNPSPPEYRFIDTEAGIWELIWNDEFDYTGLPDSEKWNMDTIDNNLKDCDVYTTDKENAYVENGILTIAAIKKTVNGKQYTTARLTTKNKGDWRYGRVEVRAKLPEGGETWAAIWMMPTEQLYGSWPKSGEIDILGHAGYNPDSIHTSIHAEKYSYRADTCVGNITECNTATSDFHVYSIEWEENEIRSYIDNQHYFTFYNDKEGQYAWPFDQRFHLLMSLAIEDEMGKEGMGDSGRLHEMEVDYVRVYKKIR